MIEPRCDEFDHSKFEFVWMLVLGHRIFHIAKDRRTDIATLASENLYLEP